MIYIFCIGGSAEKGGRRGKRVANDLGCEIGQAGISNKRCEIETEEVGKKTVSLSLSLSPIVPTNSLSLSPILQFLKMEHLLTHPPSLFSKSCH